jgi:hypothetical protein
MKDQRYCRKLFLTTVKTKSKIFLISSPARLPYKQALNLKIFWVQEYHQLYLSDNKYGRYLFGDGLSTYAGCSKKSDTIKIIRKGFHAHAW